MNLSEIVSFFNEMQKEVEMRYGKKVGLVTSIEIAKNALLIDDNFSLIGTSR